MIAICHKWNTPDKRADAFWVYVLDCPWKLLLYFILFLRLCHLAFKRMNKHTNFSYVCCCCLSYNLSIFESLNKQSIWLYIYEMSRVWICEWHRNICVGGSAKNCYSIHEFIYFLKWITTIQCARWCVYVEKFRCYSMPHHRVQWTLFIYTLFSL